MLLETHVHSSKFSRCSEIPPVSLVSEVKKKSLQGIIFTEHNYLWTEADITALRAESEVDENFLVLAGQEIETDIGHILIFGAERTIKERLTLQELRRDFPDAALVWAHPFRDGRIPGRKELLNPMLDAVEIFSLNQTVKENYLGLNLWHKYKFTALSGSDSHAGGAAGVFPTQFDHPVRTMNEIITEIKKARCRPFFKEIPRSGSNMTVTEVVIGTKGEDESRHRMVLKKASGGRKWKKLRESARIEEELYKSGFGEGNFRVPKIIYINDEENYIIEEGQRGKTLFDLLLHVNSSVGLDYFRLSAKWLARLHNKRLKISGMEEARDKERERFESYRSSFVKHNSPYLERVGPLIDFVKAEELRLYRASKDIFIQAHGDFHPKNIIIGQDRMHDISTLFISVIDFYGSALLPAVFDVGYFLSQFQNQFYKFPLILDTYKESDFIDAYLEDAKYLIKDFDIQLALFKLRANLSIASYLVKVGKGESPEITSLIKRSEAIKSQL